MEGHTEKKHRPIAINLLVTPESDDRTACGPNANHEGLSAYESPLVTVGAFPAVMRLGLFVDGKIPTVQIHVQSQFSKQLLLARACLFRVSVLRWVCKARTLPNQDTTRLSMSLMKGSRVHMYYFVSALTFWLGDLQMSNLRFHLPRKLLILIS